MQDKAIIYLLYYQGFMRYWTCYFSTLRCAGKSADFIEIILDFSKIGDMKKCQSDLKEICKYFSAAQAEHYASRIGLKKRK